MTDIEITDADRAIADQLSKDSLGRTSQEILELAAAMGRADWTPPVVDPDLALCREVVAEWSVRTWGSAAVPEGYLNGSCDKDSNMCLALDALKRGRELERAVLHIPITDQNQGAAEVDPHVLRVREVMTQQEGTDASYYSGKHDDSPWFQRLLACYRAGLADGGMAWRKHDGSAQCPVDPESVVAVRYCDWRLPKGYRAGGRVWKDVTDYLPLPALPEGGAV